MNKSVDSMYGKSFFSRRYKLHWRAPIMYRAIISNIELPDPGIIIDVGCGTGDILKEFHDNNFYIAGVEGSTAVREHLVISEHYMIWHDLRKMGLKRKYGYMYHVPASLVLSLEVAEHIEPEFTDVYIRNMINLSDQILISAAPPGQKGHHHFNCQPKKYWISKFKDMGFTFDENITKGICFILAGWKHKPGIKAYYNNLMFFRRS